MIIKCLTFSEIKKLYDARKVKKNVRGGITPGCDYVVVSIECVIELEKECETSVRFWIVNDKENLLPYDSYNFKIIDSYFPPAWIMDLDERGIGISHPKWVETSTESSYLEDYFDDIKVEKEYNKIVKEIFDNSVKAALKKGIQLNLGIKKLWIERLSD